MKKLLYLLFVPLALFGQDNYSLSFDGVDDYVDINSNLTINNLNESAFTISAFIYGEEYINGEMHSIIRNEKNYNLMILDGRIYIERFWCCYDNSEHSTFDFVSGSQILTPEVWYFISCVWDGQNFELYVNGVSDNEVSIVSTSNHSFSATENDGDLNIGMSAEYGQPFHGKIAEVQLWNQSLSEGEIQSYNICSPTGEEGGLIGYWNFNEGSGNNVYDISLNGNDGNIYGATYSEDVPENDCIEGCMDVTAFNYNPDAYVNDDSCYPVIYGCLDPDAFNFNDYDYDFFGNELTGINGIDINTHNGICIPFVNGCIDDNAYNFDQTANTDDGSCEYLGCMNSNAINFDETATIDDEQSCIYSQDYVHGLWNEVDDGAIEYEYLQDEYNTLNTNLNNTIDEATTSISSLQQALDTWNTTIDLSSGWNMFGYGCPSSIDVAEGLSNHTESIIITKDNSGNVYMPEFGFNGIGDFTPGYGYQIKLTEAIEGFSLCDWYVNDIPEDNIVSLQEENDALLDSLIAMHNTNCIEDGYCSFDSYNEICMSPALGYDCEGVMIAEIGDVIEGGYLFYIDESGQHGLVSALEDLGQFEWGCFGTSILGADGESIGTGYQNTLDIVAGCLETPIAASEALAYESDGYNDWYLPSKDELLEMYNTIGPYGSEGNIGGFDYQMYWSSSVSNIFLQNSWSVYFNGSGLDHQGRDDVYRVRPIRSF